MEAFLVSIAVVALAEIGDKTQLLALLLAARFRRPLPIAAGILIATLANHALAGTAGLWVATLIGPEHMPLVLGASFLAMAAWSLRADTQDPSASLPELDVLLATTVAFFVLEIGDKTQIATVALAAKFGTLVAVVLGTTAGMMLANVPVVWLGDRLAGRLPLRLIRGTTAVTFVFLGLYAIGASVANPPE